MKPITIIGGGLGGLWLGIRLRDQGVPVTIIEAGEYPRHRVCGEFISGRGATLLKQAGFKEFSASKVYVGRSCAFFGAKAKFAQSLTIPALHISRYELDAGLAKEFEERGGILRLRERWRTLDGLDEGFVRATGRRPDARGNGWRYFGLKAHAKNVSIEADLEMHLFQNAYVGLCRLPDGFVNVCGMFRAKNPSGTFADWKKLLSGAEGSRLNERMRSGEFAEETFCSVGGLRVQSRAYQSASLCLGDSYAMISPLAGNGMSLAIESAHDAVGGVSAYSRGEMTWADAVHTSVRIHRQCFRSRLFWAHLLESLLFRPLGREALLVLGAQFPALFQFCFQRTRA